MVPCTDGVSAGVFGRVWFLPERRGAGVPEGLTPGCGVTEMVGISTGYANPYTNTAAVTSTPANFGPGQLKSDDQSRQDQLRAQQAATAEPPKTGFKTESRGNNLNIVA